MLENIIIRQAQSSDLQTLVGLLNILFSIESDFIPEPKKQLHGLMMILADMERCCAMVAEVNGEIAGMCTAQLVVSTAEGALSGLIEDMVIEPKYRGRGIGRKLLTTLENWCFSKGATRIQLLAD